VPDEIDKLIDQLGPEKVGQVYSRSESWPWGSQLAFADGGIFVEVPGVPGAYLLADIRAVATFFRSAPSDHE
jgi:hypothetical protein